MLSYNNINEKIRKLKSGELSLTENVRHFLSRIEQHKNLNAFLSVFPEESLQKAAEIEKKIKAGTQGKLAGSVIAVKDVLNIKDKSLTCSSRMLENYKAIYTATAIQKLIDQDALIIGKTNCDEFAMGSSNENSAFGRVLNPVDEKRVPGGSSGGSAAAVKAGLCDAAIGTDTGGSVRQPAAFCGIYGLKPTYGTISRYGLTAFASSFDTVGIFSNNIEDISLLLEVMKGKDPLDSTSCDFPSSINDNSIRELSAGIPVEYLSEGTDKDILEKVNSAAEKMRSAGIVVNEISLPHTKYTVPAYYILTTAEASANLSRYDGARYGYRSPGSADLNKMFVRSRTEGFGKEVKRRIMLGTYVLSSGYYDAYYKKAQKVRRLIKQDFDKAFREVDIILTPATPSTAFLAGEKTEDPLQMYLSDIFTTSANLAGIPGLNIPFGKDRNNLPIGIQILADQFKEANLFKAVQRLIG